MLLKGLYIIHININEALPIVSTGLTIEASFYLINGIYWAAFNRTF